MITQQEHLIIINILRPYSPTKIGIFGSYARNEAQEESDLDLLVDFRKTVSLLDLVGLEIELSEQLGIKVDLVTERSVNPRLRKYIENDLKRIL
ncbi:MAG: nucleotidyltransferase [Bacteroidetes bacterium]|nr:nucleotidyltransferase [Bacteroidota bacterium]